MGNIPLSCVWLSREKGGNRENKGIYRRGAKLGIDGKREYPILWIVRSWWQGCHRTWTKMPNEL